MPSSAAMSATAVLANPMRRNSASAVSMIRARVSSGLSLTWGFMAHSGCGLVNTDDFHNSSPEGCQERGSQKSVHDPGHAEACGLDRCEKISIDRDEHIEMLRGKRQKFSILERSPAHLTCCINLMAGEVARQAPVDTVAEKNLHEVVSTSRSFAS